MSVNSPEENAADEKPPRPHLPPWLAYGGTALLLMLLAAFLVARFVVPSEPEPVAPPLVVKAPPPIQPTPTPPEIKPAPEATPVKPTPAPQPAPPVKPTTPPTEQESAAFKEEVAQALKLGDKNRWDEAIDRIQKAVARAGDLDGSAARALTELKDRRDLAVHAFENGVKKAREELGRGAFYEAVKASQTAARFYPEQAERVLPAFVEQIRAAMRDEPMVLITGRHVTLGEPGDPLFPRREATLEDFSIEKFEVTVEKYAVFCALTNRPLPSWWQGRVPEPILNHPVCGVTFNDAEAYAAWIGRRLPTADEWELAARYVDGRAFPWGPSFQLRPDEPARANTLEYGIKLTRSGTTPVGHFADGASPFGVLDLAGNVWEWTATAAKTPEGEDARVQKGGSFMTPASAARASGGLVDLPDLAHRDVGFRCARSAAAR
jgi:formylglycine-generating enzyme required for sulfatase activity